MLIAPDARPAGAPRTSDQGQDAPPCLSGSIPASRLGSADVVEANRYPRRRAAIGAIAPIDIIQAEAGVQTAELDLRQARTQVAQQELILKSALTRTGVDSIEIMDAHIITTDTIQVPASEMVRPIQDLVGEALASRVEMRQSAISMENNRLDMKGIKNAMLPSRNNLPGYIGGVATAVVGLMAGLLAFRNGRMNGNNANNSTNAH